MLMRWHWPPENSRGRRLPLATGSMPTWSSMALALAARSSLVPIFQMTSGSATMSRTLRRGLSEEIGSWKIICTWVRSVRRSPRLSVVSSVSPKRMVPEVARSTWTMARPVVDLPQPDSPTSPSVSPLRSEKLMPATACTAVLPRRKVTCRSSTRSKGSVETSALSSVVSVTPSPPRGCGPPR